MEYDPASPTEDGNDHIDDVPAPVDIMAIPLPGGDKKAKKIRSPKKAPVSLIDIPLPDSNESKKIKGIQPALPPSPPPAPPIQAPIPPTPLPPPAPLESTNSLPVKFNIRSNLRTSSSNEANSKSTPTVFDSSISKAQALVVKRTRPHTSVLPVGLLHTKPKPVETAAGPGEGRQDLFRPTKLDEAQLKTERLSAQQQLLALALSLPGGHQALNASMASHATEPAAGTFGSDTNSSLLTTYDFSGMLDNSLTLPGVNFGSINPMQQHLFTPIAPSRNPMSNLPVINMTYMVPQKLRSAQMIAQPLIANPQLAALRQKLQEQEELRAAARRKSRSRTRSRSRSGSRSRSRSRSRRYRREHHHSSPSRRRRSSSRSRNRRSISRSRERRRSRSRDRSRLKPDEGSKRPVKLEDRKRSATPLAADEAAKKNRRDSPVKKETVSVTVPVKKETVSVTVPVKKETVSVTAPVKKETVSVTAPTVPVKHEPKSPPPPTANAKSASHTNKVLEKDKPDPHQNSVRRDSDRDKISYHKEKASHTGHETKHRISSQEAVKPRDRRPEMQRHEDRIVSSTHHSTSNHFPSSHKTEIKREPDRFFKESIHHPHVSKEKPESANARKPNRSSGGGASAHPEEKPQLRQRSRDDHMERRRRSHSRDHHERSRRLTVVPFIRVSPYTRSKSRSRERDRRRIPSPRVRVEAKISPQRKKTWVQGDSRRRSSSNSSTVSTSSSSSLSVAKKAPVVVKQEVAVAPTSTPAVPVATVAPPAPAIAPAAPIATVQSQVVPAADQDAVAAAWQLYYQQQAQHEHEHLQQLHYQQQLQQYQQLYQQQPFPYPPSYPPFQQGQQAALYTGQGQSTGYAPASYPPYGHQQSAQQPAIYPPEQWLPSGCEYYQQQQPITADHDQQPITEYQYDNATAVYSNEESTNYDTTAAADFVVVVGGGGGGGYVEELEPTKWGAVSDIQLPLEEGTDNEEEDMDLGSSMSIGAIGLPTGNEDEEGEGRSDLEVVLGDGEGDDHPSLRADDISDHELEEAGDKLKSESQCQETATGEACAAKEQRPLDPFLAFPDAPKPMYEHLLDNDYRRLRRSVTNNQGGRRRNKLETRRWVCDCTVPNPDEVARGVEACGQGCINRALNIECGPRCPIVEFCTNRQFQERRYAPTEPFYAGPGKGWGLRSRQTIKPGTFVVEYVGEVIDFAEFKRRIRQYERAHQVHHYFMALESDVFIDAGSRGNWARFVNHSCESNSETQKWNVNGQIRVGFFAKRVIEEGEEITIDYQFVQYGSTEQKCYCGTPSCTGIMGSTSKQLQDRVRTKDTRVVERRLNRLLGLIGLNNTEDVHQLLQVMVQEYLLRDTRLFLLNLILNTHSEACLKLFRQYNGLEMIAAYMRDAEMNDWILKQQLLACLAHLPIVEQHPLKSGSNLWAIVRQWSDDPRYCRRWERHGAASSLPDKQPVTLTASRGNGSQIREEEEEPDENEEEEAEDDDLEETANRSRGTAESTHSTIDDADSQAGSSVYEKRLGGSLSRGPSSSVSLVTVDLETGEKQGSRPPSASAADMGTNEDREAIDRIKGAARDLLETWDQLPAEIYRIPKMERQETEKSLKHRDDPDRGSILPMVKQPSLSWGFQDDRRRKGKSGQSNNPPATAAPKLPREEFRRLFELYVRKEEEEAEQQRRELQERKQQEEQQQESAVSAEQQTGGSGQELTYLISGLDPTSPEAAERIRQLLLRTLLDCIKQLKEGNPTSEAGSNAELCTIAQQLDVEQLYERLQAVNTGQLMSMLGEKEGDADSPDAEHSPGATVGRLPPNWKWAASEPDGRVYYYHLVTKKTQWDTPVYPWDAGCDDPEAFDYNGASKFPVTHKDIAKMYARIRRKRREKQLQQQSKKKTKQKHKQQQERKRRKHQSSKQPPTRPAQVSATSEATPRTPVSTALNAEEKLKLAFYRLMYVYVTEILQPYRDPSCTVGRLQSELDLKHLAKKLTQTILDKEIKLIRHTEDLEVNANVKAKAKAYITKYLAGRGPVYQAKPTAEPQTEASGQSQPDTAMTTGVDHQEEEDDDESLHFSP